jgi:hypothetical protein
METVVTLRGVPGALGDFMSSTEQFTAWGGADVPVRAIIQRACADGHSEETKWPWYSNLPPVSWQIRADINNARAMMDLSRWNEYTNEKWREFASQIARSTRVHFMPPPKYL